MDTKGTQNADWKRLEKASECGTTYYGITANGSFPISWTCKNWDCDKCVKLKISNIIKLLNQNVTGVHLFISFIELNGGRMSRWISGHKPEVPNFFYVAIQTKVGTFLIPSHFFLNHRPLQRISKKRYLDTELPKSLIENHRDVTKVTSSRTNQNLDENPDENSVPTNNIMLATLYDRKLKVEWDMLFSATNREKAEWLRKKRIKLTRLGEDFVRDNLGE